MTNQARIAPERVDRPGIPAEYGTGGASEFVDWSHVEERFNRDRVYWIATVGADGRPRVRPVDGVYLDGAIWVGGSPQARWVQELAVNPHVSVHLDGVDDVVVAEGDAEVLRRVTDDELARRLAEASNVKFPEYGMSPAVYRAREAGAVFILG